MFVLSGGYGPIKAKRGTFDGAVAVLSDSGGGGLVGVAAHAARARELLLGDASRTLVVVLDLDPLKREIEAAPQHYTGGSEAGAGMVLGIVSTVLLALGLLAGVLLVGLLSIGASA